jgi:hypothetical protein
MVDALIETPNLDVFGGPTSIEVSTDFGKPGIRGPIFWVGNGLPDVVLSVSQKAQVNINDFFINSGSNSVDYSWLYKRVQAIGGEGAVWEKVLRLNQQQYSTKDLIFFTNGEGEDLDILLDDITKDSSSTIGFLDRFIIRSSFENAAGNPVASSFTYSIELKDGEEYLRIVFKAASFNGTTWSNLQASHNVHTFVSYLV